MSGFNFGQIGSIVSQFMDTDYIDIKRDVSGELQELYSNVPCHVEIISTDNPNPQNVDIKPIIQSLNIHVNQWVDIKNNDFIIAKKMGNDGSMFIAYSGRCGEPAVEQGRKKVSMQMNSTTNEVPTPVPPVNPIIITINYICNEEKIQNDIYDKVEQNEVFNLTAPIIEGYKFIYSTIDGERIEGSTISFNVGMENHIVEFIYEVSQDADYFRILVNGLYTKDNSELANGYHYYKKINIDSVEFDNGIYTVTCNTVNLVHEDNGLPITLDVGTKLILIPGNTHVEITGIVSKLNDKITFIAIPYTPTQVEENAYITGWYD